MSNKAEAAFHPYPVGVRVFEHLEQGSDEWLSHRCGIDGCGKDAKARGWCSTHYSRWRTNGDPTVSKYIRGNDEARFWSKVNKSPGCWEWNAGKNEDGYGYFRYEGKVRKAHRVAFELAGSAVPDDLDLDHQCRNRSCVNPAHLRVVNNKLNHENRGVDVTNTSGYRGVSFHKARGKWVVYLTHNGQRHYGGYFDDVHEAGEAAKALRNELFTHNELDRRAA